MKTFFAAVSYNECINFFESTETYRMFIRTAVVNNLDVVNFQSFRCHGLTDDNLRIILGKLVKVHNIDGNSVATWFNHARHIMSNDEALYRFVVTNNLI